MFVSQIDKEKLVQGTRVTLDMTTLTIMRALPREVSCLREACLSARLTLRRETVLEQRQFGECERAAAVAAPCVPSL